MDDAYADKPSRPRPDKVSDRPSKHEDGDPLPSLGKGGKKLGSLAQAARGKKLNEARGILIAIGVLTILVNGAILFFMREHARNEITREVDNQITAQFGPGAMVDPVKRQEAIDHGMLLFTLVKAVPLALGVVFVFLGLIVKRFPAPVTILALVLYVGATLVFAALEPETIAQGIIVKIIIVFFLVKAVLAALAYEKELRREAELAAP